MARQELTRGQVRRWSGAWCGSSLRSGMLRHGRTLTLLPSQPEGRVGRARRNRGCMPVRLLRHPVAAAERARRFRVGEAHHRDQHQTPAPAPTRDGASAPTVALFNCDSEPAQATVWKRPGWRAAAASGSAGVMHVADRRRPDGASSRTRAVLGVGASETMARLQCRLIRSATDLPLSAPQALARRRADRALIWRSWRPHHSARCAPLARLPTSIDRLTERACRCSVLRWTRRLRTRRWVNADAVLGPG